MYRIRDKSLRRYFVHRFQEFKQAGKNLQRKRQQWDYGLMGQNRFKHLIPNSRNTRYRMIGNAYGYGCAGYCRARKSKEGKNKDV